MKSCIVLTHHHPCVGGPYFIHTRMAIGNLREKVPCASPSKDISSGSHCLSINLEEPLSTRASKGTGEDKLSNCYCARRGEGRGKVGLSMEVRGARDRRRAWGGVGGAISRGEGWTAAHRTIAVLRSCLICSLRDVPAPGSAPIWDTWTRQGV